MKFGFIMFPSRDAIRPGDLGRLLEDRGFESLKIKVGKDVAGDLVRVHAIQRAIDGRGTMRVDANRAFSEADACRFAASLDPSGIELFEQPCRAEDWTSRSASSRT